MDIKVKRALLCAIAAVFLTSCTDGARIQQSEASRSFFAMDTYITITACGENAQQAVTAAQDKILSLERLWSVTDENSDIYAANHANGKPTEISTETTELLRFALDMAEQTDGALEPTIYPVLSAWGFTGEEYRIPAASELAKLLDNVGYKKVTLDQNTVTLADGTMLDLGAVGKGYGGDLVVQLLREHGIASALLDIGGNIHTVGSKPDGSDWRLGLQDPFSEGLLGVITISDLAVVTSGNYERYFIGEDGKRYGHIIDPANGYPSDSGLASATVLAKEGRLCDALSTSLFVMGLERASEYWRQHRNFEMILVTDNGEVHLTEGAAELFSPEAGKQPVLIR